MSSIGPSTKGRGMAVIKAKAVEGTGLFKSFWKQFNNQYSSAHTSLPWYPELVPMDTISPVPASPSSKVLATLGSEVLPLLFFLV